MSEFLYNGDFVRVYIDGSCINNGRWNAAAGYGVIFNENHRLLDRNLSSPIRGGNPSSQKAEVQAAMQAIKIADREGIRKLLILTDAQMLIDYNNIIENEDGDDSDDESDDEYEEFHSLKQAIENHPKMHIRFEKVRAHAGNVFNAMADRFAKRGAHDYAENRGIPIH